MTFGYKAFDSRVLIKAKLSSLYFITNVPCINLSDNCNDLMVSELYVIKDQLSIIYSHIGSEGYDFIRTLVAAEYGTVIPKIWTNFYSLGDELVSPFGHMLRSILSDIMSRTCAYSQFYRISKNLKEFLKIHGRRISRNLVSKDVYAVHFICKPVECEIVGGTVDLFCPENEDTQLRHSFAEWALGIRSACRIALRIGQPDLLEIARFEETALNLLSALFSDTALRRFCGKEIYMDPKTYDSNIAHSLKSNFAPFLSVLNKSMKLKIRNIHQVFELDEEYVRNIKTHLAYYLTDEILLALANREYARIEEVRDVRSSFSHPAVTAFLVGYLHMDRIAGICILPVSLYSHNYAPEEPN
ncbi:unnamed protein product [Bemisia tabaci]|uniref:Uncharacterized protein n=1 Tax=Bemisia tabaci TaxID=7038 RepID=A0A9P0AHV1_BEMTA|nr:unnamed protein product [Bemisia tabaci]